MCFSRFEHEHIPILHLQKVILTGTIGGQDMTPTKILGEFLSRHVFSIKCIFLIFIYSQTF